MAYIGKVPANAPLTSSDIADGIISTADLANTAVTGAKVNTDVISAQTALATEPADTDEFLVSDAGVIKRIDYSLIKGGGMWSHISTTTISSDTAQVDFTSLSADYIDFCLVITNFIGTTDGAECYLRFFDASGSIKTDSVYQWSFDGRAEDATGVDNQSQTLIRLGNAIGTATGEHSNYDIRIYNPHDTVKWTTVQYSQVYSNASGSFGENHGGGLAKINDGGNYKATGIRIYPQAGNIANGIFALYGRTLA